MIDNVMKKWAAAKNLPEVGGTLVATGGGIDLAYTYTPELNGWSVSAAVDENVWNKDYQKELKRMAKGVGMVSYREGAVLVTVRAATLNGKFAKLEQAGELLRTALPQLGIPPMQYCRFCKQGGCDDSVVSNGSVFPAHQSCKEQQVQQVLAAVQDNQENGNIVLAVVAALVGGMIGCIPSFFTIWFMSRIFAWFFVLIPLGAYFGYKLAKGVMAGWVPILVSVVSLACTFFLVVMGEFIVARQTWLETFGAKLLFGDFLELWQFLDTADLIQVFGMPFLFCIIGIALAWSQITQGNKRKLQEAEALRQSVHNSQNPPSM